jgi:hypothetical protein
MVNVYEAALYALDGSNILGITNSMAAAAIQLRDEGVYGDSLTHHPVMKLFAAKLIELTQMGFAEQDAFGDAYHICKERAASLNAEETRTSN